MKPSSSNSDAAINPSLSDSNAIANKNLKNFSGITPLFPLDSRFPWHPVLILRDGSTDQYVACQDERAATDALEECFWEDTDVIMGFVIASKDSQLTVVKGWFNQYALATAPAEKALPPVAKAVPVAVPWRNNARNEPSTSFNA